MKTTYRPEIDGLRAIAVLAVVVYHAEFSIFGIDFFQGGFLGVDIFFVISGYLISTILLKELNSTNRISFAHFYERRARRILPALLVVMVASMPFAWNTLLPTNFIEFSQSILFSLGFSSNFYFHFSGLEYGAQEGALLPFLHTWSLSVEEQYYIIFPLLLIAIHKLNKKHLSLILGILFVVSLLLAQWGSHRYASATFYFLHTRMWELLAGTGLAVLELKHGSRPSSSRLNVLMPWVGVFIVLHAMVVFHDRVPHPSLLTLYPITGVCILVWFSGAKDPVTRILASKPFVAVGLISYSLYLWHYPIFAFGRLNDHAPSSVDKMGWIFLALVLSIASYYLVERPFRNKKRMSRRALIASLSACLCVVAGTNAYVVQQSGLKGRFQDLMALYGQNEFDNRVLQKEAWSLLRPEVPLFSNDARTKILFVGDSHSKDMFNVFYQNTELFPDYEFSRMGTDYMKTAFNIGDDFALLVENDNYQNADHVVISDSFGDVNLADLAPLLRFLKAEGKDPVLMSASNYYRAYPDLKTLFDVYMQDKMEGDVAQDRDFRKLGHTLYSERNEERFVELNKKLKAIAREEAVTFLNKQEYLCDDATQFCDVITDEGYKIYFDESHYTLQGAKYFGEIIARTGWFALD